jgi:hypothetical protein
MATKNYALMRIVRPAKLAYNERAGWGHANHRSERQNNQPRRNQNIKKINKP